MARFTKLRSPSAWRKLALVTWSRPADPSVYMQHDFDATAALAVLAKLNAGNPQVKITMTHLVAKGVALTLAKHPALNGIICFGNIYLRDTVDIFLQVAIEAATPPGGAELLGAAGEGKENLSGAKIASADKKDLRAIAAELYATAAAIRVGRDPQFQKTFGVAKALPVFLLRWLTRLHEILVYDLGWSFPRLGIVADPFGSAMVTSVGTFGVPAGFAPLVPPSRCPFLACVGAVRNQPWAQDAHTVVVRPVVPIAFTFDHRFIDGQVGARMFKHFLDFMQNPGTYLGVAV